MPKVRVEARDANGEQRGWGFDVEVTDPAGANIVAGVVGGAMDEAINKGDKPDDSRKVTVTVSVDGQAVKTFATTEARYVSLNRRHKAEREIEKVMSKEGKEKYVQPSD